MKVRSDILRVYKTLHTWVGITSGLLLFIGFFAGAVTMFKQPVDRWVSAPEQRLPGVEASQLDSLVQQVVTQHPEAREGFTLYLRTDESISAPVRWEAHEEEEGEEGHHHHGPELDAVHWHASLDSNGELNAEQIRPTMLGELIDMLHRTGGVPGTLGGEQAGILLMGVAGILYSLALVSGLIILLPTLIKDFFILRRGKNRKRFWLDAHNVIGITSLPFHLIIAMTVVVFAFHDQFYDGLHEMVYGEQPMFGARPAQPPQPQSAENMLPVSELIRNVQLAAPDFEVTEMLFMGLEGPRPVVRAGIYNPDYLVHGPITAYAGINPYSGDVTMTNMIPGEGSVWSEIVMHFFALHFGSFGGDSVRWVYFLLGLSGAFLFYSGNLLWVESRRKKQKRGQAMPQQQRNTRWMAAATVGVCLGSMAGVAIAMAAGKWGTAFGSSNVNALYVNVYYTVFLASVIWAFWRGAARASVSLLLLCAFSCALIPLTSLIAVVIPATGLWAYTSLATLSVDLTALLLAAVFLYAARRSHRRLSQAGADTVWSYQQAKESAPEGEVLRQA